LQQVVGGGSFLTFSPDVPKKEIVMTS
jgi:hypothetical protein